MEMNSILNTPSTLKFITPLSLASLLAVSCGDRQQRGMREHYWTCQMMIRRGNPWDGTGFPMQEGQGRYEKKDCDNPYKLGVEV
jgi:hypothetical protein